MLRDFRNVLKNEDGSEVVTFVIIIPLFMFIFAMMVTFSQILYASSVGLNAANAGCRQAIICDTEREAREVATNAARTYVNSTGMGCSFISDELQKQGSWNRGNICTYIVNVDVKTAIPLKSFSNNYRVQKASTMMIERTGG